MGIFVEKRVINISSIPEDQRAKIFRDKCFHNNSYCTIYVCGELKHISEVVNEDNILKYPGHNEDFVYERGDDPVSDILLDNGAKMGEEIILLCGW
jgi:hypothetical protein